MSDARSAIIQLGEQLSRENDAAHDLWSWLPSHRAARAGHGDYAIEFRPSVRDIMVEAATFIGHGLNPTAEERAEAGDLYKCPCGEEHSAESDDAPRTTPQHVNELAAALGWPGGVTAPAQDWPAMLAQVARLRASIEKDGGHATDR